MFCQGVKYIEGSILYRTNKPKSSLNEVLGERPYCWDSFIAELTGEKGIIRYRCSDDKNIDDMKWLKVENEFEIKIDRFPLQAYGPS